jgi:hypothetical protein
MFGTIVGPVTPLCLFGMKLTGIEYFLKYLEDETNKKFSTFIASGKF